MANPDKKSQDHTQKTNSNLLQEPWKEIGMTEQDYKAMMSSDNHARHAEANSSKNKPWEQVGMTEQDYKAMMSDSNPRIQTASTYQNQSVKPTTQVKNDITNIKNPTYLYNEDDIKKY